MKKETKRAILSKAIALLKSGKASVYVDMRTNYTKNSEMSFDHIGRIIDSVPYKGHLYTVQIALNRATRDGKIDRLGQKESFDFPEDERRHWSGQKLIQVWY